MATHKSLEIWSEVIEIELAMNELLPTLANILMVRKSGKEK